MGKKVDIPEVIKQLQEEINVIVAGMIKVDDCFTPDHVKTLVDFGIDFMRKNAVAGKIIPQKNIRTGGITSIYYEIQESTIATDKLPPNVTSNPQRFLS